MKVKNKSAIAKCADAAKYYGLKPYPLGPNDKYKYLDKWSGQQFKDTNYSFENAKGIALFTGVGGLETLDIDAKNDGPNSTLVADFLEILSKDDILSDVKFCYVKTKSNGLHIHYKASKPPRNESEAEELCNKSQILAHSKDGRVIIETLGFGKLVTIPPTNGYKVLDNCKVKFSNLPTLTSVQLERLYTLAKAFSKHIKKVEKWEVKRKAGYRDFKETWINGDTPNGSELAKIYNAKSSCVDILKSLGWTEVKRDTKGIFLKHPYATNTHSARVFYNDLSKVTFFSMGKLECKHGINKSGYAWTTAFNLALDCLFGGSWNAIYTHIKRHLLD